MVARFRGCSWHLDRGAPLTYCLAMPEIAPVSQSVSKGWMALSRGSWKEARASFEQELEAGESAEALEGLSWAAWWLDDADTVFEARERAYRRYRERRDPASAARMALLHRRRPRPSSETVGMRTRRLRHAPAPRSAFAGFRFPPDVIVLAVRWYLRFGLSYRDLEELLAERGVEVDHVTIYRWVQRFTPLLVDAARPCRHAVGDRWQVDETYVKVAGQWRYVYRAIDQFGQVIDVFVSRRRDITAARRFLERAIGVTKVMPVEITSDQAPVYPAVLEELVPAAWHRTDRYGNNRVECDHGRLKARLRPMRGLKHDRSARVILAGHAFVQNVRRGHYELAVEEPANRRVAVAVDELAVVI